jgi:septin family protein
MASIPQAPLPQQEIKVAFLGPTGSGKTTLINDMLDLESNVGEPYPGGQPRPGPLGVSAGANSMTSETTVVRGQLIDGTPCTCIDTPGLNDTGNKDSENIVNMVRTLKEQVRVVHMFVIVLNGQNPRLDQAHKDMISIFGKCFGSDFMQNMVLVFTRWHNDEASIARRVEEMCSNGFQGSPEEYRAAEFKKVFQEAFHFTGVMKPIFGDFKLHPTASSHEKDENNKAKRNLSIFGRVMTPFPCQNIKATKTFLDAARGELKEVQQKNDELSAQYEEQKRVHSEEMSKIRKEMDASNADNAGKLRL